MKNSTEEENCDINIFITILKIIGITVDSIEHLEEINGFLIERDTLLNENYYNEIKQFIPDLKKEFSSTYLTSLQKKSVEEQKWPLINLLRQILNVYKYSMKPLRKSDGYDKDGVKQYKRFFLIERRL